MKRQCFMRLLACTQLGVALGAVLAARLEREPDPVPEERPREFIYFEEVPADSLEDIMLGGLK